MWYHMMKLVRDDDHNQKYGFVVVIYNVGVTNLQDGWFDFFREYGQMAPAIPYKAMGMHFCYDRAAIRLVVSATQMVIGRNSRARFRTHHGKARQIITFLSHSRKAEASNVSNHVYSADHSLALSRSVSLSLSPPLPIISFQVRN